MQKRAVPQIEMGAGIAASPHCAERRICWSHQSGSQGTHSSKSKLTSSGVASHLTTPSEEETDRPIDCATRRLACLLNYRCLAEPKPSDVPRPFLGRSLLRPALLFHPKTSEPRRARGRSTLPAPLPDWPRATPKSLSLPVGGDRSFRPLLPREAGTSVPITF